MALIVSLTSTSARLVVLKYTLKSIFEQELVPDKVVLNLSKEPYLSDEGVSDLPLWLDDYANEKFEINWVKNTGPYRKLMPVYQNASANDMIVTCDDDVIYGPEWLGALVGCARKHSDAIICGRARKPVKTLWGTFQSYVNWPIASPGSEGYELLPTGVAGVLYRKNLLDDRVMSCNDYLELAPKQDDLWFHLARQVIGAKVVVSACAAQVVYPVEAPEALFAINAGVHMGDRTSFFAAKLNHLVIRIKARIGVAVCDNDRVLDKLKKYKAMRFH